MCIEWMRSASSDLFPFLLSSRVKWAIGQLSRDVDVHRLGAQSDCAAKNPKLSRKKQIEIACHCLRRTPETGNFKPTPTPSLIQS